MTWPHLRTDLNRAGIDVETPDELKTLLKKRVVYAVNEARRLRRRRNGREAALAEGFVCEDGEADG